MSRKGRVEDAKHYKSLSVTFRIVNLLRNNEKNNGGLSILKSPYGFKERSKERYQ